MGSILIADNEEVFRYGLKRLLSEEILSIVLGEASSGEEALRALARRPWDLVLLGMGLPDHDGFEVLQKLRSRLPATRILVLGRAFGPAICRSRHAVGRLRLRRQRCLPS